MNKNIILEAKMLSKSFSNGGEQQHIIKNLNLTIYEGDFTVIMGSSGSGKSTLLYALSSMDKPTLGQVIFGDTDITKMSEDQLAVFRRDKCGFVFQQIYLNQTMSVLDNVLINGYLLKKKRKDVLKRAYELLEQVDIDTHCLEKPAATLSGGEAQRVGIVRALINNPQIIFGDEPTGALNSKSSKSVLDIFTQMNQQGQSIVLVTHDIKTALRGNRILYLRDGVIEKELELKKYSQEDETRFVTLQNFLNEMGW